MNKFGIFNLLNSFFPLNAQKNQSSPINDNAQDIASGIISSLGKTLFSGNNSQNENKNSATNQSPNNSVPMPLQKNMLLTINSHDEFVKRVKEKHDKLTT